MSNDALALPSATGNGQGVDGVRALKQSSAIDDRVPAGYELHVEWLNVDVARGRCSEYWNLEFLAVDVPRWAASIYKDPRGNWFKGYGHTKQAAVDMALEHYAEYTRSLQSANAEESQPVAITEGSAKA